MRTRILLAAFLLLCCAPLAGAGAQAIATTDRAEVCASVGGLSYSKRRRMPEAQSGAIKRKMLAEYNRLHYLHKRLSDFELDHDTPLCLGGSNDKSNLKMQPIVEAKVKDQLEAEACRRVCHGPVPLAEAQAWFADWKASYRKIMGREP